MNVTIGIADDHQLFLKSLSVLISGFPGVEVVLEALQGEDLLRKLALAPVKPDLLLIDVNMPVMDGPRAAANISRDYPAIKMVALSMKDDDTTIIRMFKAGCCAYLLKDIHPDELEKAFAEIQTHGYYNADAFNINHRRLLIRANEDKNLALSADGYRESLFQKLNVKSRVGMVLEAIRLELVSIPGRQ